MSQILFPLIFFGFIGFIWWTFVGKKQSAQIADQTNPDKRWAGGVYTLVTGGTDYGYEDKWDVRLALSNSWSIENALDFQKRYAELTQLDTTTQQKTSALAWNLVRAVNLSRMAAGAAFISQEESWAQIATLKPKIQAHFDSWQSLGTAYVDAWRDWVSANGGAGNANEGSGSERRCRCARSLANPCF